jgi:hypothetical protein
MARPLTIRGVPVSSSRPGVAPFGPRTSERGFSLVWAAFGLLVILGVVATGTQNQLAQDASAKAEQAMRGQARAVAEAGVVDAFAWFRRQQVQPVAAFAPVRNLAASPPINETDDPTVGLVRDYEIQGSPSLWGRYEVRKTKAAEVYTDSNGNGFYNVGEPFTDLDGDGRWDSAREVRDVSSERGLSGAGAVWLIESHGLLYERPRLDLPLSTPPNRLLASSVVGTEIRRLTLVPPAAAALCVSTGSSCTIGRRGRIRGLTGGGIAYPQSTGTPTLLVGAEVTGAPATTSVPSYAGSIDAVFGVPLAALKGMADVSTSNPATVASPIGDYTLTVIDGNATFDAAKPLRGTGVVVVLGDCTLTDASNSFFSGILWVQGMLTVRAPCFLRGVLIAASADVRGTGGDYAEVDFDNAIVTELLYLMGQYRHSKALYAPNSDPDALQQGGP